VRHKDNNNSRISNWRMLSVKRSIANYEATRRLALTSCCKSRNRTSKEYLVCFINPTTSRGRGLSEQPARSAGNNSASKSYGISG